ncbi:hypothetical protein NDU88_002297 [Pleurodeles waltl]|uniref:Uncharacterized protein n=1 Tax=Pleurodeles waltl TaxID=8319 RepID=A0AAV7VC40_PLEWA|nr:hypothetical protein NDU88_002297 [Pleurodeles waltl]
MDMCNRASVAVVTNYKPGPAETYPGGTLCSHADPEVISNADIRDATQSVEEDVDPVEWHAEERKEDASEEKIEPGPKEEHARGPRKKIGRTRKFEGILNNAATSLEGRGSHRYGRTLR